MKQVDYNAKFWSEQVINLHQLFTFTAIAIQTARRHARSGHKDEARDFLRYLRNARVIEILKPVEWPVGLAVNVPFLEGEINELAKEVHPLTAADNTDDLASINRSLHLIAAGVARILAPGKQTFSFPTMTAARGRTNKRGKKQRAVFSPP